MQSIHAALCTTLGVVRQCAGQPKSRLRAAERDTAQTKPYDGHRAKWAACVSSVKQGSVDVQQYQGSSRVPTPLLAMCRGSGEDLEGSAPYSHTSKSQDAQALQRSAPAQQARPYPPPAPPLQGQTVNSSPPGTAPTSQTCPCMADRPNSNHEWAPLHTTNMHHIQQQGEHPRRARNLRSLLKLQPPLTNARSQYGTVIRPPVSHCQASNSHSCSTPAYGQLLP